MVVTHDQEEAMTLSTRIGVMNQGQIVQIAPRRRSTNIEHKQVADFIGSVNLFEAARRGRARSCADDSPRPGQIYVDHGISSAPGARVGRRSAGEDPAQQGERDEPITASRGPSKASRIWAISRSTWSSSTAQRVKVTMPNQVRASEQAIGWDDRVSLLGRQQSVVLMS